MAGAVIFAAVFALGLLLCGFVGLYAMRQLNDEARVRSGAAPEAGKIAEFDSKPVISVSDVMAKLKPLRAECGGTLSALQLEAICDNLANWADGKVVEIPLQVDGVDERDGHTVMRVGRIQPKRLPHDPVVPIVSIQSPEVWVNQKPFTVSMPKEQALSINIGQQVLGYFSIMPGTPTKPYVDPSGAIMFGVGESIPVRLLDVTK